MREQRRCNLTEGRGESRRKATRQGGRNAKGNETYRFSVEETEGKSSSTFQYKPITELLFATNLCADKSGYVLSLWLWPKREGCQSI